MNLKLQNSMGNDSSNILEHNCRPNWPLWTCYGANVCGLCSTTLWFLVLLPQVWKNFRRKSVVGLSVLWATANFTASLTNFFFVYLYAEIPLYGKINSIYMPVLEFTILIQFWLYGHNYTRRARIIYIICCFTIWGTIITLQLAVRAFAEMQWLAIALWCIETFPQVILNLKRRSTSGQATKSVIIALTGKTTDFLATYGLVLPIQYVVMTYFSSSVAYINGLQVVYYYKSGNGRDYIEGELSEPDEDEDARNDEYLSSNDVEYTPLCSNLLVRWKKAKTTKVNVIRWTLMSYLSCVLLLFVFGLVWNTNSFFAILGPTTIISVLTTAYVILYNDSCHKCRHLICK